MSPSRPSRRELLRGAVATTVVALVAVSTDFVFDGEKTKLLRGGHIDIGGYIAFSAPAWGWLTYFVRLWSWWRRKRIHAWTWQCRHAVHGGFQFVDAFWSIHVDMPPC